MRVFVTGATGFVGSAVVSELIGAGHQVLGLARSDAAADALNAAGAQVHRGDLQDFGSLRSGALQTDGIIHTGFIHDFSRFAEVCEIDRQVIGALGEAIAGTTRPLVVTSGTALLSPGRLANEDIIPAAGGHPRVASEIAAAKLMAQGANVSIVRLSPSVHGNGDHGFVPMLIDTARKKGASAYVGEGRNRWSAVHRLDAARLYRLAVEKGAAGARYHGVAEPEVTFRDIAEVIGRRLNLPVVSKSLEEAREHFGFLAHFAALDCPASSRQTQQGLGWQPTHPGLIADLDRPAYFGG